ncbi:MAG: pyridoxine 5'-phosphate synthase [Ectothiorhodospiraceae bacterium]|nr:pyridoxine 5'-phosphate synthase [Ectothiorhodospiraceae bacterium]
MRLCVNIDHIATLREARGGLEPDPVVAAGICELHGADGIVCHLREDRRHINDRDVRLLREVVQSKLDLEMAVTDEIMEICIEVLPELATFVPEKREELTTEGGLDVISESKKLERAIDQLHAHEIEVSLFVDPIEEQIRAAAHIGADIIELHTGEFANAVSQDELFDQLDRLKIAAELGATLDLGVHAGHGLNYRNLHFMHEIEEIEEVSIGHAIISRAVMVGLPKAVEEIARIAKQFD